MLSAFQCLQSLCVWVSPIGFQLLPQKDWSFPERLLLCILSLPLNPMNMGLDAISANIKNDVNLEPTAK